MDVASASLAQLRDAIEELYACSEQLMDGLTAAEWTKRHGPDWTMASVPYHLAYFDRELVADAIEAGGDVPEDRRAVLATERELDAWNARMFAQRPSDRTVEQDRAELREVRERVRGLLAGMTDADLDRRVWFPLAGLGWRSARTALGGCICHNWSEHTQLRLRLGKDGPVPSASTVHLALDGYMRMFPMALNADGLGDRAFAVRFTFTGPGGGDWVIAAREGRCEVREDATSRVDFRMKMSPDTFARMWNQMNHPMLLMLTGRIRLQGIRNMPAFGKIFPQPKPDSPVRADLVAI